MGSRSIDGVVYSFLLAPEICVVCCNSIVRNTFGEDDAVEKFQRWVDYPELIFLNRLRLNKMPAQLLIARLPVYRVRSSNADTFVSLNSNDNCIAMNRIHPKVEKSSKNPPSATFFPSLHLNIIRNPYHPSSPPVIQGEEEFSFAKRGHHTSAGW
jgi:hypothetical protein